MTSLPDAWVAVPTEFGGGHASAEEDLWQAAVMGQRAALRRVYERYATGIHRFLRDLLRDDAAAADATQETFARAFRSMASLRDGERLRPWLFGIARNVSLELIKSKKRAARLAEREAQGIADRVDPIDPEVLLLGREAENVLGGALARMGHERRAALLLRVDHGLAYEEIAELCGWSLAKVKVEIHRARCLLRNALADEQAPSQATCPRATEEDRRSRG